MKIISFILTLTLSIVSFASDISSSQRGQYTRPTSWDGTNYVELKSDRFGSQNVNITAKSDPNNSRYTILTNGEQWQGSCSFGDQPSLITSVKSDQPLTYRVKFYSTESLCTSDIFGTSNTTAEYVVDYSYDPSTSLIPKRLEISRDWFRVEAANNSGVDMTKFTFQTRVGRFEQLTTTLDTILEVDYDATVTKSINTIQQPDKEFLNERADGAAFTVDDTYLETDTPLGANETYTSGWVRTDGWKSIEVSIKSDQVSADNGIIMQYSGDTSVPTPTVDLSETFTFSQEDINNGSFTFSVPPRLDGFRLRYINGPTAQTSFFVRSTLRTNPLQSTSIPLISTIGDTTGAIVTQSIIKGKNESTENYDPVETSPSGSLKVAITDRPSEVRQRVKVQKHQTPIALTGTPTVLHTVTSGYIFYLTSLITSCLNDSQNAGQISYRDSGTTVIGQLFPGRAIGAPAAALTSSPPLPEPIEFTTNFSVVEVAGDITCTMTIIGYEEPI